MQFLNQTPGHNQSDLLTNSTQSDLLTNSTLVWVPVAGRSFIVLPGIISKATLAILLLANSVVVIFFVSLTGSILNVINMTVFIRQGLKDPVTITLFILSVSDFGSVITLWFQSMFMIFHFFPEAVPGMDPRYLTGFLAWPHSVFVRVSCLVTTFIAFERWICVAFPLHANRIITAKVAKIYNSVVLCLLLGMFSSLYYYSTVARMFLPRENKTLFIITLTPFGRTFARRMSSVVTSVYLGTFGLLAIFTVLTIIKLNQQAKWRQKMSTSADQMDAATTKTQKVVKMVMAICFIFIACTIPSMCNTIAFIYVEGYIEMGRYFNLYSFVSQLCFTLEASNSTANFFVYYRMSSNFKSTLKHLLGKEEVGKK